MRLTFSTCLKSSLAGVLLLSAAMPAAAAQQVNVMFIVDSSGSMAKAAGTETRMAAAKRALSEALREMPQGAQLGLTLYGHRRGKDCSDIELVSPVGADDASAIATRVGTLQPRGETPIAEALKYAQRSFAAFKGQSNHIVLLTDGIEECRGDPCAAAQDIAGSGLGLKAHVVGFTLNDAQRKTIECVTKVTGGTYFEAANPAGLKTAMAEVRETVVADAAPPVTTAAPPSNRIDLLAKRNGGQIVAAPEPVWESTVDGSEDYRWGIEPAKGEGVYGFADEKPATFDRLEVFIGKTDDHNPKTLEVLAGNDGPAGKFRLVGTCTFQNIKLVRSPYQACTFPAVTARYVQIKVAESFKAKDDRVYATEFRLMGALEDGESADASAPAATPPIAGAIDLIASKNGGGLAAAPSPEWESTVDGTENYRWGIEPTKGAGVYAFKDDQPATFDRFEVFIGKSDPHNPKVIELLAGDDSPTGKFRPIATCTFQNIKLNRTPYQPCTFPAVTAKYVQVKMVESHKLNDPRVYATEFRLMGKQ